MTGLRLFSTTRLPFFRNTEWIRFCNSLGTLDRLLPISKKKNYSSVNSPFYLFSYALSFYSEYVLAS